ncbi:MAG: nuclear transport factor 2 family protein [Actinomycetota bacterium]|nr:nuclear transport factor 2 family protein [Actinomycetota bacterium]
MPSAANVETVRRGFEAFNSGEIGRILAFAHPDFEAIVPPELSAEPDTYRGHEGIRRYFESFKDVMEEIHFQAERFWEAGDSVVADVRLTARGRETAIPVEQHIAQVWTMRDGMALRVQTYVSLSQALGAVGLRQ